MQWRVEMRKGETGGCPWHPRGICIGYGLSIKSKHCMITIGAFKPRIPGHHHHLHATIYSETARCIRPRAADINRLLKNHDRTHSVHTNHILLKITGVDKEGKNNVRVSRYRMPDTQRRVIPILYKVGICICRR